MFQRLSPDQIAVGATRADSSSLSPGFIVHDERFLDILGSDPVLTLQLEDELPFAHEAGVYLPEEDAVFVTSNQVAASDQATPSTSSHKSILIHKLRRDLKGRWSKERVETNVILGNGAINYNNSILFCAQGDHATRSSLVSVSPSAPYEAQTVLDSFHGRQFNSLNDVVVKSDGSIWFTDPIYGFEQGVRPRPQLPSQVYRFDPSAGSIRAIADGFGRPNGLCFSPDEGTLYVTDTDWIHGDGTTCDTRVSSIYAFDVLERHGAHFLGNRRLFAMADNGVPDGIKTDLQGNVYAGCGDGVNVWSPTGTLLGKVAVPGGVANFCFARSGELLLLNETKFWTAHINPKIKGALLQGMGIDCDVRAKAEA